MEKNNKKLDLSRRDFVTTAAVGLGGISATALAGAGATAALAAQTADRLPTSTQGAGAHEKLMITISPGGDGTPKEQADGALEGFKAGASVVHIRGGRVGNAQMPQGKRGANLENWKEITDLVRAKSDIVINYGSAAMEPSVRKPLLTLKPEASSVMVSHHYGGMAVSMEDARQSALNHLEAGVLPEVEIFHSGDLANLAALIKTGVLHPPYCVTIFLGYGDYYRVPATLQTLQSHVALLPPNTHWTFVSKGPGHIEMAAYAIALGGHVRTGLENEVEIAPGRPAKSEAEIVERIARLAEDFGRKLATPQEARAMLALPRKPEKLKA